MNPRKSISKNQSLERAIAHFGSLSEMARKLGLSGHQVIQHWRIAGRVPPQYCTELAKLTGERREDLVGWPPEDPVESVGAVDDAQPPVGTADPCPDDSPHDPPDSDSTASE